MLKDGEDWPEKIPSVELEEFPSWSSIWNPEIIIMLPQELQQITYNVPVFPNGHRSDSTVTVPVLPPPPPSVKGGQGQVHSSCVRPPETGSSWLLRSPNSDLRVKQSQL